jgi:molybdopterin-guanine dinucleotide biosynthesis protein B
MTINKIPLVLGFYGESDSGKTTLVERLILELTREGNRVAAVKRTDQPISIDSSGKDTNRYAQAGAQLVVFSTQVETAFLVKEKNDEAEIIAKTQFLGVFDFIFVEGANEKQTPKIRLGNIAERENTLFAYDGNFEKLLENIKNRNLKKE